MDPYAPLYEFLRNSPPPNIPVDYKQVRDYTTDADGKLRTVIHKEWLYTWPDQWWDEWMRISKECEEKEKWCKEAERQVFVQKRKEEIKKGIPKENEIKQVAVTLAPCPEHANVKDCLTIAEIVKSVSAVKSGCYVFEQRSMADEEEHGWHLHFSVDTTYAPSKVGQFIKQKLESRGFKIKPYCTKDDGGFRNKYMKGVKNHASKDPKVRKDFELREKYGLQHFYEF